MTPLLAEYLGAFSKLRELLLGTWVQCEQQYPPTLNQTLRFFIDVMHSRARGVYVLLLNEAYWDSEIVLRSFYEAFARCLTFATSRDPAPLLREFWSDQLSSDDRRTAQQAGRAARIFPAGDLGASVMAAMADEKWFDVEPKLNKKERRGLNQKWSFTELVEELSCSSDALRNTDSLLHMYGMQSAVAHVSAKFYDLLWDRTVRGDDLEALENGHVCRQMSDAVWMTAVAMFFAFRAIGAEDEKSRSALEIAEEFSKATVSYAGAFDATQRTFYENHGHTP